ncbi:hypothetical protein [Oscillatoria acuminata]|uniref:hypothetical protein n=1 Tax=Oscillatoria acuminata TaxID=118323 RepID=UPI0012EA0D56|nr:hypothetical protein [Oscillatoria acuminata]
MSWDTLRADRLFNSPDVSNPGTLASETDPLCQESLNIQAIAWWLSTLIFPLPTVYCTGNP